MIKFGNLLKEIKPQVNANNSEDLKNLIFQYYKKRLNNPEMGQEDKCIGDCGYFEDEAELKDLIEDYFDNNIEPNPNQPDEDISTSQYWDYKIEKFGLSKDLIKLAIKRIKEYYSGTDDTGPMESLLEYAQPVIDRLIKKWASDHEHDEPQKITYIEEFSRLKNSIRQKFQNPTTQASIENFIPRNLQDKDKYLDITLWDSFSDIKKLVDSQAKKTVDIYEVAKDKFKAEAGLNDDAVSYYTNTFKRRLGQIDQIVSSGGDGIDLIPQSLRANKQYRFITNWNFHDVENLLDTLFPRAGGGSKKAPKKATTEEGENTAEVDANLIYEDKATGIEVYKGDSLHACIKYGRNEYYSWCISRNKGSLYYSYRLGNNWGGQPLMFYFVIDRTQTDEKKDNGQFINPYHVAVIHVLKGGKYRRSDAQNSGDEPSQGASWENLGNYFKGNDGKVLWDKIKGLEKLFVYQAPGEAELKINEYLGKKLTVSQFQALPHKDKEYFLIANAKDRTILNDKIIEVLPDTGEVSINALINHDRLFTFDEISHSKGLLKRYARYRFTRHGDDPIPYKMIPYLYEEDKPDPLNLQEKYLKSYATDNLDLGTIEEYFKPELVKKYVDGEAHKLAFLPDEAAKHMDPEQKEIFEIYKQAFIDSRVEVEENKKEGNDVIAPNIKLKISKINLELWNKIPKNKKQKLIELIKQVGPLSNEENPDYIGFFMGIPVTLVVNGKLCFYMSNKKIDKEKELEPLYSLVDEDGNFIRKDIKELKIYKDGEPLEDQVEKTNGWGIFISGKYIVYDFDYITYLTKDDKLEKADKSQLVSLMEQVYWQNNSLLFKAGLLK